jgi:hypothetical protein
MKKVFLMGKDVFLQKICKFIKGRLRKPIIKEKWL